MYLADIVEVPVRYSLLSPQFPMFIEHGMQLEPCIQVVQPIVTE